MQGRFLGRMSRLAILTAAIRGAAADLPFVTRHLSKTFTPPLSPTTNRTINHSQLPIHQLKPLLRNLHRLQHRLRLAHRLLEFVLWN